jgi:hypothetical protein
MLGGRKASWMPPCSLMKANPPELRQWLCVFQSQLAPASCAAPGTGEDAPGYRVFCQSSARHSSSADQISTAGFDPLSGVPGKFCSETCRLGFVSLGRCFNPRAKMVVERAKRLHQVRHRFLHRDSRSPATPRSAIPIKRRVNREPCLQDWWPLARRQARSATDLWRPASVSVSAPRETASE